MSSLTDSINKDITNSLSLGNRTPTPASLTATSSTSSSTTTTPKSSSSSSSSSPLFFLFILVIFALLVFLFFYYYEGLKETIVSFLPRFITPSMSPTPSPEFITTPPVTTLSPTSIPTTNLHDQPDYVRETKKTSGTKEPQIERPTQAPPEDQFNADDSYSTVQQNQPSGKSGWCFIGEDRGFRSCAPVITSDTCMSGDIFPSKDKCINPNLRWS